MLLFFTFGPSQIFSSDWDWDWDGDWDWDWDWDWEIGMEIDSRFISFSDPASTEHHPSASGQRPGITSFEASGQWRFPRSQFTKEEKRMLLARAVAIGVKAMFRKHLYQFAGKTYLQSNWASGWLRSRLAHHEHVGPETEDNLGREQGQD